MELFDIMRATFSARRFTDDPLPDDVLFDILDNARFAPSGGNRQGWRVIVVRDHAVRNALADLAIPGTKRYMAQLAAGENPWNSIDQTALDEATIEKTPVPPGMTAAYRTAPVVLVVCVDLKVVASTDQNLPRVGVVSGASVYPFTWNVMLAARHEGYAGIITTLPIPQEPAIKELLGIPGHIAVAAIMPLGRPVKVLTRLKRKPVSDFATRERWGGAPLTSSLRGPHPSDNS